MLSETFGFLAGNWLKVFAAFAGYFVLAPLLGLLLAYFPLLRKGAFGLMVWMTSWHINKLIFVIGSIELYRGHTKGFEISLIEMLAVALIVQGWLRRDRSWRWFPPSAWLYLLYCGMSMISIFAAPNTTYVWMACFKFTKALLIFVATYNFLRTEKEIHFFLKTLVFSLFIQLLVVLKIKYIDGVYQPSGWFEHQNPLAMWAYMCGLPLLAAAMGSTSWRASWIYLFGFFCSALLIQSTLSRASMAVFGLGVILILGWLLLEKLTLRRLIMVGLLSVIGFLGILKMADTIIQRFNDPWNQASIETRQLMNLSARAMLKDSWIGCGWNNFGLTINQPYPYGDVIDDWYYDQGHRVDPEYAKGIVESHYWLLLAETGYPGFLSFLLLIGATLFWALGAAWAYRRTFWGALATGLFIALGLTYLHSTLEHILVQTKNLALWLMVLALVARLRKISFQRG